MTFAAGSVKARPHRPAGLALLALGLAVVVVQLAVFGVHLGFGQDEVDYLARVNPSVPELYWTAVRAWGMPILAAPAALLSPGVAVIRLYFVLLLAAGLVLAYLPWCRVLRSGVAPLAALLFASTWVAIFYGDQVMPNLPIALGCLAAIGLWAGLPSSTRPRRAVGLMSLVVGTVALVRPTDSVLLAIPMAVFSLGDKRRPRRDILVGLVAAELMGWVPWLVEAYTTFGGPAARWHAANQGLGGTHLSGVMFAIYPRLFDGSPGYCCYGKPAATAGPVSAAVVVWFVAVVVLALAGILLAMVTAFRAEIGLLTAVAAAFALFYVGLLDYGAMRFLLPILALLSIPIALVMTSCLTAVKGRARIVAVVAVAGLVGCHLALQADYTAAIRPSYVAYRTQGLRTYVAVKRNLHHHPCLFVAPAPQIVGYYLRCHVLDPRQPNPDMTTTQIATAQQRGWAVIAVLPRRLTGPYAFAAAQQWIRRGRAPSTGGLWVYVPSGYAPG